MGEREIKKGACCFTMMSSQRRVEGTAVRDAGGAGQATTAARAAAETSPSLLLLSMLRCLGLVCGARATNSTAKSNSPAPMSPSAAAEVPLPSKPLAPPPPAEASAGMKGSQCGVAAPENAVSRVETFGPDTQKKDQKRRIKIKRSRQEQE